jgi:DNA (cytosine-5)-methyltransferase 1
VTFTYADLFAGIGGFHAAMSAAGGTCVFASEIDDDARRVYELNWGSDVVRRAHRPIVEGDIIPLTEPRLRHLPQHEVLVAGFPCQPFSKSGHQRGLDETRGTLFFNILKVLKSRRPPVVMLENVRNLVGPRHRTTTWPTILERLRDLGYKVSSEPTIFSPHNLPPRLGGTPQIRDRVFIVATHVGRRRAQRETDLGVTVPNVPAPGWDPTRDWTLARILEHADRVPDSGAHHLDEAELTWIAVWDDFVRSMLTARGGQPLPGHPIWADDLAAVTRPPQGTDEWELLPTWKQRFLAQNSDLYIKHQEVIDDWFARSKAVAGERLENFPASRRKLEWQAQDAQSLWDTAMHLRPSGIRAKKPTYLPALVAINQTSILGSERRRLTVREAARLQGLPEWFNFGAQSDSASFKQLGNAVAVGAVYHVLRAHVANDPDVPEHIRSTVLSRPVKPKIPRPSRERSS